jgi:type II secretory pathway pseudopilin PulG
MTELLVVIGVIAVLAGVLLAALSSVRRRALATQTESTMQEFARACEAFQIEHGRCPGVIPDNVLAHDSLTPVSPISGTENALFDLMGGYALLSPLDNPNDPDFGAIADCGGTGIVCFPELGSLGWELKVDINRIGEGPRIDGTPYAPYFTPSGSQVVATRGQVVDEGQLPNAGCAICVPDLLDAWGQPMIYLRRCRTTGPLLDNGTDVPPQFFLEPAEPYLASSKLGELGKDQTDGTMGSIFNTLPDPNAVCAQAIRHPGFGGTTIVDDVFQGTPQGAFVLISAGPDGVFFSKRDGPGSPDEPIGEGDLSFDDFLQMGPSVFSEFDDLRMFGGG